jgi:fatty acid desaturase
MKKNMGVADRIIRTALAVVVAVLYFTGSITGVAAIVLGVIAAIFILTGAVGTCPLYTVLGIKTTRRT